MDAHTYLNIYIVWTVDCQEVTFDRQPQWSVVFHPVLVEDSAKTRIAKGTKSTKSQWSCTLPWTLSFARRSWLFVSDALGMIEYFDRKLMLGVVCIA